MNRILMKLLLSQDVINGYKTVHSIAI